MQTIEKLGRATYSPEDNKLRFYPDSRLSKEDYERARAHGFKWAPKQELFVAPMWTPEREDLLLEWCGEVEDEDTSLVERAEQRADRFQDYSENRKADADSAHATVSAICDNIPLGQPILVGHHSESRARKDAERIESGMRRAVKCWEQSQYWQDRARGAIGHAKYKEQPAVRARRIKGLEADKRKQERYVAECEHGLRFWQGKLNLVNRATGEKRPLEITEENRLSIWRALGSDTASNMRGFKGKNGECSYSAWDILCPVEDGRYQNAPEKTVAELQEKAVRHFNAVIAHCQRWIRHYDNRLTYERAMLAEDGGTVADKTGPEVGGAVRCWAAPGYGKGWAFIQKVNKVSVTIHSQADYARADCIKRIFRRIMPFDKLVAVMTKAEVDAARAAGTLLETHGGTGFYLCEAGNNAPAPTRDQERDAAHQEALAASAARKAESEKFSSLKTALKAGVQVVSAPQLFPTPPEIAQQMVELAGTIAGRRVLEPSAGTGRLVEAMAKTCGFDCFRLVAVERNASLAERLRAIRSKWLYANESNFDVRCSDFLACNGDLGKFDLVLMNPPFERGSDIEHILHARSFLKPGGRLVAICANGPKQREALEPICDRWIDLPDGSFQSEGTNVRTALLVING